MLLKQIIFLVFGVAAIFTPNILEMLFIKE